MPGLICCIGLGALGGALMWVIVAAGAGGYHSDQFAQERTAAEAPQ